jgi:hypothetical protein
MLQIYNNDIDNFKFGDKDIYTISYNDKDIYLIGKTLKMST